MRRILVVTLALGMLGAAAAAYAASGPDQSSLTFSSTKAGTKQKPAPIAWTLHITGSGIDGQRPAITLKVEEKIYGLTVNEKNFPTCSLSKIAAAHNDTVCPKKALVATGSIQSLLGPPTNPAPAAGSACDPTLDVWNGGQGKLTYFFVTTPTHQCLGGAVTTGETPPYPGTYSQQGKYLVSVTQVPSSINYPIPGEVGSLEEEQLVYKTQSTKVHGKTVISQASVACSKGKRPYTVIITTAPISGGAQQTQTIKKSAAC